MKIAVDISQIVYEGTGVSRYLKNLKKAFETYDKFNLYTYFESIIKSRPYFSSHLQDFLWNRLHITSIDWFIGKQDILITSDWTEPLSKAKKITVVHDLIYKIFPETVDKKIIDVQTRRMKWVKKESKIIIADSESTKQDLIDILKIEKERIRVVYPAVEIDEKYLKNTDPIPAIHPYILTVGKLEPRKNIPRLIEAFVSLNIPNLDLYIVGPTGWETATQKIDIEGYKTIPNIKMLGFVEDEKLYSLYKNAEFFIMPSIYEGFGYPLVEAMILGCPTACSNTSSLKEIGQDISEMFDPNSVNSIKKCIIKMHGNENLREENGKKGIKRAKEFSIEKFYKNFLEVFNSL
jgi:glycosyltransferase involved in cell wall biosynthesis